MICSYIFGKACTFLARLVHFWQGLYIFGKACTFLAKLVHFCLGGATQHPLPPNCGQVLRCQYQSPYRPNGGAASPDTCLSQRQKKTKKSPLREAEKKQKNYLSERQKKTKKITSQRGRKDKNLTEDEKSQKISRQLSFL